MQIESITISKLTLLEKNPRRITKEQMEKLCKSIQDDPDFLWNRPALVNKRKEIHESAHQSLNGYKEILEVYAGNQRVRAAKKLKMKEIPCIVECDLSEDVVRKRVILDNKTFGEFDYDILANEYDLDMLLDCGFNAEEILGDLSNISDDERIEEEKEKKAKECPHCGGKL